MVFKRNEQVPRIKRSTTRSERKRGKLLQERKLISVPSRPRRRLRGDLLARSGSHNLRQLPQTSSYTRRSRKPRYFSPLLIIIALSVILLALTASLWLPAIGRIIPKQYIAAYAPQPVQDMVFQIDVNEKIPTPSGYAEGQAETLLEGISAPTPTAYDLQPTLSTENPAGYIQPTPVPIAPTPTVTPFYVQQVDPRADDVDNSADLSTAQHLLTGFTWEKSQGWNNCGPASLRVFMSYWDVEMTEIEVATFLKPHPDDPNVRPDELAAYVNTYGYDATIRVNGTVDQLKQFIMAGYPVMVETGYDPEPDRVGWTSHFLTLTGFTDEGFIAMDTYRRPNWLYTYDELDYYWRQFNRRYIIFHRPDQGVAVNSLVGTHINDEVMYESARYAAQLELGLDRNDPFGWANLGASLVGLGDYENAVSAYNQARQIGLPWRYLWYQFEAYEAYMGVGAYDEVIALADSVLQKTGSEEAYYFKGIALIASGDTDAGRRQLELALRFNKRYEAARIALETLAN